jgi:hypothetical protein
MKQMTRRFVEKLSHAALRRLMANPAYTRILMAQGTLAALHIRAIEHANNLADVEFRIFSEYGEDGILEWLVHHNGTTPECFIEFGVHNYVEANTRFLLMFRNWRGLVFDGDKHNITVVRDDDIYWRHDLTARQAFITRENINSLIIAEGLSGEIGILSVDIDGNDYWTWEAIDCVNPHIVVIEYNAVLGDRFGVTVPYDPHFARTMAHPSNLYYGASIVALTSLADRKGYALLGTNRAGNNAFFVRKDRLFRFDERLTSRGPRPSRFREARDQVDRLAFVRGVNRAAIIARCPVVDVATGRLGPLGSFGNLYSDAWAEIMEGAIKRPVGQP